MNQELFINTIIQTVTPVVTVILEVGLVIFVAVAIKFIKKYLVKLGIVIDDQQMTLIENIIQKAVITINQKMVDDMKELSPNGKLTDEQKATVYNAAYKIIKDSLTQDQLGLIKKIYGDDNNGIGLLIENMVVKAKESKSSEDAEFISGVSNILSSDGTIEFGNSAEISVDQDAQN